MKVAVEAVPTGLVLWDIDGTLLRAGPVAREALERAVGSVAGRDLTDAVVMAGKTDRQIVVELMAVAEVTDEEVELLLPGVLAEAKRLLAESEARLRAEARVMPGIPEILELLHHSPRVVQSLLTGNLEANARLKLAALGLDMWFDFEVGAYGDNHIDRNALGPIALERGARRFPAGLESEQIWVIGDTPRDGACARSVGARCLLVATGNSGLEELAECHPTAVLPDLSDTELVMSLLLP